MRAVNKSVSVSILAGFLGAAGVMSDGVCSTQPSATDSLYWCGPYGDSTATAPLLSFTCQSPSYLDQFNIRMVGTEVIGGQFACDDDTQSVLIEASGNYTNGNGSQPIVQSNEAQSFFHVSTVKTYSNETRVYGMQFGSTSPLGVSQGSLSTTTTPAGKTCKLVAISAVTGRIGGKKALLNVNYGFRCSDSVSLDFFGNLIALLLSVYLTYFIIGCVIVFLLLCCLIGLCCYCCRRKRQEVYVQQGAPGAGQPWWLKNNP